VPLFQEVQFNGLPVNANYAMRRNTHTDMSLFWQEILHNLKGQYLMDHTLMEPYTYSNIRTKHIS